MQTVSQKNDSLFCVSLIEYSYPDCYIFGPAYEDLFIKLFTVLLDNIYHIVYCSRKRFSIFE